MFMLTWSGYGKMEAMFYISLGYTDCLILFSNKNKLIVI
jgi:hypothetical protein